jgi:hypothetical protein
MVLAEVVVGSTTTMLPMGMVRPQEDPGDPEATQEADMVVALVVVVGIAGTLNEKALVGMMTGNRSDRATKIFETIIGGDPGYIFRFVSIRV